MDEGCMDGAFEWYAQLAKPGWAPPAWLFGPVWSVLYAVIAVSFGTVFVMAVRRKIPGSVTLPFLLNLASNLAFTPIQFGLRNNILASVDILLVLVSLCWAVAAVRRHIPWVAFAQLPYLAWVSFATVLQISVTWLNR